MTAHREDADALGSGFTDLWYDAVQAYQVETKRELQAHELKLYLRTPEDLLDYIESQGEQFANFRDRHRKLWSRMRTFALPIASISSASSTAVSSLPPFGPPASAVLGAVVHLVRAADKVKDAFDWIQTLFGEFERFTDRLQQYLSSSQEMNAALQRCLVSILTCLLRLIGRSEALIKGGRFREYLKCAFLSTDERTKGLLDDLNVQLKGEQGMVLGLSYTATRNAEDFSRDAADSSKEAKETAARIETRMEEKIQQDATKGQVDHVKQTLQTPAADLVCKLLSTQRQDLTDGTGAWLQKESLFNDWVNGKVPILLILGGPGSGKSFLATQTVLYLQERFNQTSSSSYKPAVSYFFIKDSDANLVDANNILKTLALQIAEVDTVFQQHVASVCTNRASTITADDTWMNIFVGFYSTPMAKDHYAFLILDGLDEAPPSTRRTLLSMVKTVTGASKGISIGDKLQFGIFGRPDIRGDFDFTLQEKYIEVSSSKNENDMRNFILSKIPNLALIKEMRSKGNAGQRQAKKMSRVIAKKVFRGADGVFLWAKLHMRELEELNWAQMNKALSSSPQSLDDMISKLLHRISDDDSIDIPNTNKLLTLVCFAQRPLLFGELKFFLSLPDQQPDMLLWRKIRGRFASLFELDFPIGYNPDLDQGSGSERNATGKDSNISDQSLSEQAGAFVEDEKEQRFEQDDSDADSDFSDVCGLSAATFDLGLMPKGKKETAEYANTFHDSDGQLTTLVHFTHLRIKDFLLKQSQFNNERHSAQIWVDTDRAEIDVTICCLQALRQGHETRRHRAYLVEYAARHFIVHLANLKQECLTSADVEEIVRSLVQIFYDAQTALALLVGAGKNTNVNVGRDEFWTMWISTQDHREVVQWWLRKPEADRIVVNDDARAWLHHARKSVPTLLKPMMRAAAEMWLTKSGYDDEAYTDKSHWLVNVICAYMTMDDSGYLTNETYREWSWVRKSFVSLTDSVTIHAAADWAKLEKTTHWHTGLGWILMDSGWPDEAIAQFDSAIQLDAGAWVALEGKARCMAAKNLHAEAIQTMGRAIDLLPETLNRLQGDLLPPMSEWKATVGDSDGSYEAAMQGFKSNKFSLSAQNRYIAVHSSRENGEREIVNMLKMLHDCPSDDGHSVLTHLFISGYGYAKYDEIGSACSKSGKPTFLLEAMDESLAWSKKTLSKRDIILRTFTSAHIRYLHYENDDEAMKLWEQNFDQISQLSSTEAGEWQLFRVFAANRLSLRYFDMAVAAKQGDQGYSQLATRLKELSVALASSLEEDSFEFYSPGYPSLLWGRWLREHEKAEPSVWRVPFRSTMLDQMNRLDDDDPANDTKALKALARGLFHAGQREEAGAILAILFTPLEHLKTERNKLAAADPVSDTQILVDDPAQVSEKHDRQDGHHDTNDVRHDTFGDDVTTIGENRRKEQGSELKLEISDRWWGYFCDNCDHKLDDDDLAEIYFCEICEDINWCGECLRLVKTRGLAKRGCNPRHPFYKAWPVPDEARNRAAVWLDGVPELRRDWLESLRNEWL